MSNQQLEEVKTKFKAAGIPETPFIVWQFQSMIFLHSQNDYSKRFRVINAY
jgi:hypothetical protein